MKQLSNWIKISIFFMVTLMFPSMLHAGDIYEAEDAVISGAAIASNHTGYSGTGFVDYRNASNDYIEWTVNATNAGQYILNFGYALGNTDRPLEIRVNGQVVAASQSFPGTGGWTSWDTTANLSVNFNAGSNTIRATAIGSSGANVDYLEVTAVTGPNPEPILSITKDSNISGDILPGDIFTYTIVVENDASATGDATNVTVRDPLPTGVTYVAASAQKTYPSPASLTYTSPSFGTVDVYGTGSETLSFDTTGLLPADAMLTQYSYSTNGESLSPSWRAEIHLTATHPTGTAYDDIDFGEAPHNLPNSAGVYSVSQGPTSVSGTAVGVYSFTWTEDYNDAGINNAVAAASFTIDYTVSSATITDSANDPEFMVTAADNITLKPGETLTVTFEVKADDDLTNISDITNTAYAASTEITTEISASTTNNVLPVTISHVHPESYGDTIEVTFGTATETGNLGFNIYGLKGKGKRAKWTKLNEALIPGALDSFEPQEYTASVNVPEGMNFKKIGIAGVDVNGNEDRHGPFKIGKQSGEKTVAIPVNWSKIRKEVKADRKAKKAKRKARRAAKKETRQTLKDEVVTLKVSQKAVYKVTHDDLIAQGIDLRGFKANKIALSLKGEGVARYISELNSNDKWTKNSSVEFIGERPNVTDALYVDTNKYRLSLNKNLVVESEEIDAFTQREIVIEHNNKYAYSMPLNDPFYEEFFYTLNESETKTYKSAFDMPIIPEGGTLLLSVHSAVTTKGAHKMDIALNGTTIANATAQNRSAWIVEKEVDSTLFKETGNELIFTLYGEDDGMDIVAYDKLVITYNDDQAIVPQKPEIEVNDKVSKKDIRVKNKTNYLMISHPLFINETLERYVEVREGEGWKIQVVNVEDIYSAYTNGMALPEAIKSYIEDATQKGVTHIQLVGASSHDNLDYLGTGSMSLIPTIYTLTNKYIHYTPCDACYVLGGDELPTVAIGRWSVHTQEEFETVINKTLVWQPNSNTLLIADQIDSKGTDFKGQMNSMAKVMEENGYAAQKIYLDDVNEKQGEEAVAIARESIQQSMLEGVSIVSYSGHGAPTKWSTQGLLKQEDVSTMQNGPSTPIALPFTCMVTYADSPLIKTLGQELLTQSENGAVAVYGATIYSSYADNGKMVGKVFNGLTKGETIGEAILNQKIELGASYRDVIRNGNLLGDVTLKLK